MKTLKNVFIIIIGCLIFSIQPASASVVEEFYEEINKPLEYTSRAITKGLAKGAREEAEKFMKSLSSEIDVIVANLDNRTYFGKTQLDFYNMLKSIQIFFIRNPNCISIVTFPILWATLVNLIIYCKYNRMGDFQFSPVTNIQSENA